MSKIVKIVKDTRAIQISKIVRPNHLKTSCKWKNILITRTSSAFAEVNKSKRSQFKLGSDWLKKIFRWMAALLFIFFSFGPLVLKGPKSSANHIEMIRIIWIHEWSRLIFIPVKSTNEVAESTVTWCLRLFWSWRARLSAIGMPLPTEWM